MTIEKIEIGKSVEALHEWHKLSLTVSILPGEDPQLIHNEAKELLDKLLPGVDSGNDHNFVQVGGGSLIKKVPEEKPPSKEQGLIEVFQQCSSINALERFRKEVERVNAPEVKEAFENKLKSLK